MADTGSRRMRVDCRDCPYSVVASPRSDRTPSELVVEHGADTGHTLSLTSLPTNEE